jgi:CheY-like chemotaxis protein
VILLVEDDVDVRELLEFTLKGWGYTVEVAQDGAAALEALARARPCLMILDLFMPRMTGWAVMEQMKARNLQEVPVCVITALEGPNPPDAVATLSKPFDASALKSVASKYCSHAG